MSQHDERAPIDVLTANLNAVRHRLLLRGLLQTAAILGPFAGVSYVALLRIGLTPRSAALMAVVACGAAGVLWMANRARRLTLRTAAGALEAATPASRNVIVTAEELLRHPERARPDVFDRVLRGAAAVLGPHVSTAVPLRRDAGVALGACVLGLVLALGLPRSAAVAVRDAVRQAMEDTARDARPPFVRAVVTPPAYTGEPAIALDSPERIEAVRGSRLRLLLRPRQSGGGWRVRFGQVPLQLQGSGDMHEAALTLSESGYIAIEPPDAAEERRVLLPVAVSPDRAPAITIGTPGKDLLLPDAKATIAVAGSATDDFGLQALELKYTKVSGSGEQFEFNEGSIPLAISRDSDRSWKARASLSLASLALAPGDALVYRIVGRDRQPDEAGLASSDTFFVEVAGPGQVALAGFDLPPDRERYALSQQMIVLKLQRLKARLPTMDRATLEEQLGAIAAEQRAVRANFIFLTGGHVEDEEQEAEQSHEIQEGRLENTARQEIMTAIQHMSRAEQGMALVQIDAALPAARAAVEALQRAFGRNRYFLRTLPVRSRIDPSRRMTGQLSEAADWRRELFPDSGENPKANARAILARVLELSAAVRTGSAPPAALTALAERAVSIDPSSKMWQEVSKNLLALRDAREQSEAERAKRLDDISSAIAAATTSQSGALNSLDAADDRLRIAWGEERRRQ